MVAGGRLGRALRRRLAARAAAEPAPGPPPGRRRRQRRALLLGRRHAALRRAHRRACSATSCSPCSATATVTGAHDGRYNVLLARRRLRRRPLGPAPGLDDGRQHRRRDRPDRADRAAAQHGELPVRQGLGDGRAVPRRLRLRDYLNGVSTWAQDNTELFPGSQDTPAWTPRSWRSRASPASRSTTGRWSTSRGSGTSSTRSAASPSTCARRSRSAASAPTSPATSSPASASSNGHDTLWFARAREGSDDYSRMARQKCVMDAMLHQISPQTAVKNFQKIATASSAMISTNIPASEVDRFVSAGPQGPEPEDLHALPRAADDRHRAPGHRRWSRAKVPQAIDTLRGHGARAGGHEEEARRSPRWSPAARWARCTRGTPPTSPTTSPRPAEPLLDEREVTARGGRSRASAPVGCGP